MNNIEQLEADLWSAADNLRANPKLTSSEYCMPVLGVIFLRHATNRYDDAVRQIQADQAVGTMPKRPLVKGDFLKRRALQLPPEARYDELLDKACEAYFVGREPGDEAAVVSYQTIPMRRGPLRSASRIMKVQYQRHLAMGLAVTVALTGVLLLRQLWPEGSATIGTIPTGASFNLAVARYHSTQEANAVAANVQAVGLPAFTRRLRNGVRQVIVGPYVSIDEAESAQRLLARRGFGRARMLVDESVRRTPGIGTIQAPKDSASTHDSLVESIRMAVQAVEPEFAGDRAAQARQAVAQFHAAAINYGPLTTEN